MTKIHWLIFRDNLVVVLKTIAIALLLFALWCALFLSLGSPYLSLLSMWIHLAVFVGAGAFFGFFRNVFRAHQIGAGDFFLSASSSLKQFYKGVAVLSIMKTSIYYVVAIFILVILKININKTNYDSSWLEICIMLVTTFPVLTLLSFFHSARTGQWGQSAQTKFSFKKFAALVAYLGVASLASEKSYLLGLYVGVQGLLWLTFNGRTSIFKPVSASVAKKWFLQISVAMLAVYILCFVAITKYQPHSFLIWGDQEQDQPAINIPNELSNVKTSGEWAQWYRQAKRPMTPEKLAEAMQTVEALCPPHLENYLGAICFSPDLEAIDKINTIAQPTEEKLAALLNSNSQYAHLLALTAFLQLPTEKQFAHVQQKIDELVKQDQNFAKLVEKLKAMKPEKRPLGLAMYFFPAS